MKQNEDINDLLARHLAHESMTEAQQQQLDAWIAANPTEYRRLMRLTDALRPQADESDFDARQAWLKVEPHLKGRTMELHRKRRFITFCSIAASLLLLLGTVTVYLFHQPAVHYVNNGQTARHLLLPGALENTRAVLDWIAAVFAPGEVLVSLMAQYTPQPGAEGLLARRVTGAEYRAAVAYMENVGIQSGYTQEAASAQTAYTPDFDLTGLPQEEE